ncbi:hypothetical protein FP2506_10701 [Fulvimarina pelagi HTCC2506]|uniref:Uncharacterized protein n=1 Tax=Fulvimarina pelagi HTCC2506 TaxID=314231 RepID=Q0G4V6_9HYPH|nr:hypothetical protein FP2506_10701 [Fulvimarina pelagi HTCC2506]
MSPHGDRPSFMDIRPALKTPKASFEKSPPYPSQFESISPLAMAYDFNDPGWVPI